MKKQLFTIISALSVATLGAQVASPSWTILQNASFTLPVTGHRFIDAVSPNVAWVSGYDGQVPGFNYNFVSKTNNAGANWSVGNVFSDTNTYALANMEGLDANTAWITAYNKNTGGGGVIYRTTNAGGSWTNMTPPGMFTNTAAFGNWIGFLTPSVAVVNGDPVNGEFELWRTTDGGLTFTQVPGANIPNPQTNEFAIVDMYATFGPNHFWFGTNQGRVYRSTDAGVTWSVSSVTGASTPTSSVIEIDFSSPTIGLCYMAVGGTGVLYNTYDGGVSWTAIPAGTMNSLPNNYGANEMAAVPGTTFFVSAGNGNGTTAFGGLSYSMDNGKTWVDWGSTGLGYTTIDFSDRWTGWSGGFSNFPDNSWPGVFKYNGNTFNALFNIPGAICMTGPNATITPVNNSGSPDGPLAFNWTSNPPAQFSSVSASVPVITFTTTGTYTITLQADDPDGPSTMTQVIQVASCSAPTASFSIPAQGCNNSFMTLTNNSTGGPAPNVTISILPIGQSTISAPSGNQYSILFGSPGVYTVTMDASSISGNSSATQTVLINDCRPSFNISLSANDVCRLDTVFVNHNFTGNYTSFNWSIQPPFGVGSFAPVTNSNSTVPDRRITFLTAQNTWSFTTYTLNLSVTNQYGTSQFSTVLFVDSMDCDKVSINETVLRSGMSIYPNPAHEVVNISLPSAAGTYELRVFNVLGSEVIRRSVNGSQPVSLTVSGLKKGVYFVEAESGGSKTTGKFIID